MFLPISCFSCPSCWQMLWPCCSEIPTLCSWWVVPSGVWSTNLCPCTFYIFDLDLYFTATLNKTVISLVSLFGFVSFSFPCEFLYCYSLCRGNTLWLIWTDFALIIFLWWHICSNFLPTALIVGFVFIIEIWVVYIFWLNFFIS